MPCSILSQPFWILYFFISPPLLSSYHNFSLYFSLYFSVSSATFFAISIALFLLFDLALDLFFHLVKAGFCSIFFLLNFNQVISELSFHRSDYMPDLCCKCCSSNSLTICPLPNSPRSPPLCPEGHVENSFAASSNTFSPLTIDSRI